jgi:hypothetical protein
MMQMHGLICGATVQYGSCLGGVDMLPAWREFQTWRCVSCNAENTLLGREDDLFDEPAVFDRVCAACGSQAPGTTIRPAQVAYRVIPRGQWRPHRGSNPNP